MAKQNNIQEVLIDASTFGRPSFVDGSTFSKPAEVLSKMKELQSLLAEADETTAMVIKFQLNALAKAFSKLLVENFDCSDEVVKGLLGSKAYPNTVYIVPVNNTTYKYSRETIIEPEVDKSYLASEGVKTIKALYEKLEAEGKPIPACLHSATKTIISFKPENWAGEPLAKEVTTDIISINEKEIKNK